MYDIAFVHTHTHLYTYLSWYGRHFSTQCVLYLYHLCVRTCTHAAVCVCSLKFEMLVNKWHSIRVSFTYDVQFHTPIDIWTHIFSISHTRGERDRHKHAHTTHTHACIHSHTKHTRIYNHNLTYSKKNSYTQAKTNQRTIECRDDEKTNERSSERANELNKKPTTDVKCTAFDDLMKQQRKEDKKLECK